MPAKLPKGWVKAKLGDACLPVPAIQPADSPDTEFTYFDIGGIDNRSNAVAETKTLTGRDLPSRARQALRQDDILFSNVRTYLRKIARVERAYPNPIASTGFTVIRAAEGVSPQFLFFQVLSEDFLQPLHVLQTGSSYPAVRTRDVLSQPILLPPALEQVRIVAKLSAVFSRLARGEAAADRARQRLEHHRVEVVRAAVTGELTRHWREARTTSKRATKRAPVLLQRLLCARRTRWQEALGTKSKSHYVEPAQPDVGGLPKLPEGWGWASIDQLSWTVGYGTSVKCTDKATGPAVLRIPNIRDGRLDLDNLKFAGRFTNFRESDFVAPGDLLLIRTNGSKTLLGRTAIVKTPLRRKLSFASYLIRFRLVGDTRLWSWLSLAWNSEIVRSQLERRAKTTAGQYNLSLSSLANVAVPIPPTDEQVAIVGAVEHRLSAAERLDSSLNRQLTRSRVTRQHLLHEALTGRLVAQDPSDEPAGVMLETIRSEKVRAETGQREPRSRPRRELDLALEDTMQKLSFTSAQLTAAFRKIGRKPNAEHLFKQVGCAPDDVITFYEVLRATPEVRCVFQEATDKSLRKPKRLASGSAKIQTQRGRFRLVELWLENFKNLKDYTAKFDSDYGLDIVLGWNGTGKSNLFESLVIIFRDLHQWSERARWSEPAMNGYRILYEVDDQLVHVAWNPSAMKRPAISAARRSSDGTGFGAPTDLDRTQLPLPRFVFGYYSGPTNRLAEHFQPMKQAHYVRLRESLSDDPKTLATLLAQRRFFCAETHHAKYVLLAFCYKDDPEITHFLREHLRVTGFESALFIIRKPRWAKSGAKASEFWGAKGVMRRVLERLRHFAIAPMVLEQTVSDGYRTAKEDHYYFFLPDLARLHAFAAEYEDARTFFLALESTDFSELIYDVKIQVQVSAKTDDDAPITFREMSEGEQQLLMVLGLMRFTKSAQSLVLLDEPDTHLNPHWSINYLKLLTKVMGDGTAASNEQQTSQILISTHDPLVIASLMKEQVHLMKRDHLSGACAWIPAAVNPRGLGFTGILTSEMFGFRSDLDEETLADLDTKVRLMATAGDLNHVDQNKLEEINRRLAETGFHRAFSDPYYAAFVRAWGRKYSGLMSGHQFLTTAQKEEIERAATVVLGEAIAEIEKEVSR